MVQGHIPTEVLEKIEKIQTLIDRAGTDEEANAAAAALTRVLTRHSLTMMDIEGRLGGPQKSIYGRHEIQMEKSGWRRDLLHVVARNNFGRIVIFPGQAKCAVVCDERSFEIIVSTYKRLEDLIWKVTDAAILRIKEDWANSYEYTRSPRTWSNSYRLGMVQGISVAMREAKNQEVQDFTGGSGLVVIKDKEVAQALHDLFPRLRAGGGSSIGNSSAYKQGFASGKGLGFGQSVGAGSRGSLKG
jgi:hypothetical protein